MCADKRPWVAILLCIIVDSRSDNNATSNAKLCFRRAPKNGPTVAVFQGLRRDPAPSSEPESRTITSPHILPFFIGCHVNISVCDRQSSLPSRLRRPAPSTLWYCPPPSVLGLAQILGRVDILDLHPPLAM